MVLGKHTAKEIARKLKISPKKSPFKIKELSSAIIRSITVLRLEYPVNKIKPSRIYKSRKEDMGSVCLVK